MYKEISTLLADSEIRSDQNDANKTSLISDIDDNTIFAKLVTHAEKVTVISYFTVFFFTIYFL